jgi:alpha-L-fucosidase
MNSMVERFGGLKLMMEHRFYGDSLPFGEESFENRPDRIGLLSMENALGDYAALISEVKREVGCADCPVLALGGSYPGMLTAYFRYKYPSIVDMGLPASAALFMNSPMTPQYAYYDIITKAAAKIDPKCPAAVRTMFKGLAAASAEERTKGLSLCYPASTAVEGSWDDLEFWTTQWFAGLGMGNYPPVSSPFKAACTRTMNGTMSGLAPLVRLLDGIEPGSCFNITSMNPTISVSGNTSFCSDWTGCPGGWDGVAWDYQACTESIEPLGTRGPMFPAHEWSVDWLQRHCSKRYGVDPQPRHIEDAFGLDALYAATHNSTRVVTTGVSSAGTHATYSFPAVDGYSRLVFSNGALDGWSAGSVLRSAAVDDARAITTGAADGDGAFDIDSIVAIVMPNGAHHVDLRAADPNDTPDVLSAREQELAIFGRWIKQLQVERLAKRGKTAHSQGMARQLADEWLGPFANTTVLSSNQKRRLGPRSSAKICESACKSEPNCTAWTWEDSSHMTCGGTVHPKQQQDCWVIESTSEALVPKACPGHVAGYKRRKLPPPTFPVPTNRQLEWMAGTDPVVGGLSQFMHFGLPTFWVEGDKFDPNGTYHDCMSNAQFCTAESCGSYAPCLSPKLFGPSDLDAEQWVLAAKSLGVQEICLTAQHEGGFALWPSNFTNYSVAASPWKGGKGDVLREFADACNKHGMGICYYLHPSCDHYSTMIANVTAAEFSKRQVGKIREALTKYGPVNRFWFDGKGRNSKGRYPAALNLSAHFEKVISLIRAVSPSTLVSGYREFGGDIGNSFHSLYLFDTDLVPNTTSLAEVGNPVRSGYEQTATQFFPLEQVGICMQEGPDGNTDGSPTYWFNHPLVGHSNASRIFNGWLNLIGHGENGMVNIAPGRTGKLPDSYLPVMADVGKAIRGTFTTPIASLPPTVANCSDPNGVVLHLTSGSSSGFDYIETKEDVSKSQRIMGYAIEYRTAATPEGTWLTLVPAVEPNATSTPAAASTSLQDRPAGFDKRDQYIGFRRIDVPVISLAATAAVEAIRFRCLRSIISPATGDAIYLKALALYKENTPWGQNTK